MLTTISLLHQISKQNISSINRRGLEKEETQQRKQQLRQIDNNDRWIIIVVGCPSMCLSIFFSLLLELATWWKFYIVLFLVCVLLSLLLHRYNRVLVVRAFARYQSVFLYLFRAQRITYKRCYTDMRLHQHHFFLD